MPEEHELSLHWAEPLTALISLQVQTAAPNLGANKALQLGLDGVDFDMENLISPGFTTPSGMSKSQTIAWLTDATKAAKSVLGENFSHHPRTSESLFLCARICKWISPNLRCRTMSLSTSTLYSFITRAWTIHHSSSTTIIFIQELR